MDEKTFFSENNTSAQKITENTSMNGIAYNNFSKKLPDIPFSMFGLHSNYLNIFR